MEAIERIVLSNAVSATLMAVVVAVLASIVRHPSVRFGLWLLVLVKHSAKMT